eukprot:jgi/Chrzof1/13126/Cz07g20240.t1
MSAFTGWKFLVNFLLPPPLFLTLLLVLPFPRNVRKGILLFTNRVLSFSVVGGMKLVHFSLILSGVPLLDSGFRTFKSAQAANEAELTPNQRISLLAKKWREERNFWIAAMAFTLWCILTVLYGQVDHAMKIEDEIDRLRAELDDVQGVPHTKPAAAKVAGAASAIAQRLGLGGKQQQEVGVGEDDTAPAGAAGGRREIGVDAMEMTPQAGGYNTAAGVGPAGAATRRVSAAVKKGE